MNATEIKKVIGLLEREEQSKISKKIIKIGKNLLLGYGNHLYTEAQKVNKSLIDIKKKLYILRAS